jgi:signal transduction histidine kinase
MFELMAELIAFHVTALDRPVLNEDRLHPERERAEMREQFIAVVGHDLRNPLAAIGANVATLRLMLIDQKALRTIGRIEESAFRMAGIVDDMMDLARGYLGGELALDRDLDAPLAPVLGQVIAELCAAWPDRAVETHFAIVEPVRCDHRRIGQLFSNILGNALTYGAANAPVRVQAVTDGVTFQLSVSNAGDPIPPATLQQLFHPFFRGANSPNKQGLGLGLHIASEVARAHGGTLEAVSSPEETRFTFRMPL